MKVKIKVPRQVVRKGTGKPAVREIKAPSPRRSA